MELVGLDGGVDFEGPELRIVLPKIYQVAKIAQVVEGFVWVFDREFADVFFACQVSVHCVVEFLAVPCAMEGWEDQELGEAFSTR